LPDDEVARGARLAALGGCAGCHSREDAPPFAGGVPISTSFGTIYATNITPDRATGIGTWSETDFVRAMREGIEPSGRHLYPAFPYDHFTHTSTADLHLLYAFLVALQPAYAEPKQDELDFPFGFRGAMAEWNLLYLHEGPLAAVPAEDPEFDRGRYLVTSLGHCGGCHTPRGALGAERADQELSGAIVDGWYAPPLNAESPSPIPWTVDQLADYLRFGIASDHAIAGGPMQHVTMNLGQGNDRDLHAIAVYLVRLMGPVTTAQSMRAAGAAERAMRPLSLEPANADPEQAIGASVYVNACGECHDAGRRLSSGGALQLPLAVAVHDADPHSLLRIIREGVIPTSDARGRWMPGFDGALTDVELQALSAYLRRAAGGEPPWPDLPQAVIESAR
jgi:mono/diheme cytochrome c family protein